MNLIGIPSETWFPVITLIVGAVLKAVFDFVTDSRMTKREGAARKEQRIDATRLKRVEFQRDTFLAMQDALLMLSRLTGQAYFQDLSAQHKFGTWQKEPVSEETSEGHRSAIANVNKLRVRINNDDIRQLVKTFTNSCVTVTATDTADSALRELHQMAIILQDLQERIGNALRSLDSDEDKINNTTLDTKH